MGLFDALFRSLTGGRSPRGERRGLRQQMTDLERQAGSAREAAKAAGVSRATWWRWKTGRSTPAPAKREQLTLARRRAMAGDRTQVALARTARRRVPGVGPKVSATFTVSADTRYRTVTIGSAAGREHVGRAAAAFDAGLDDLAAAELQRALDVEIGQRVIAEDPEISW